MRDSFKQILEKNESDFEFEVKEWINELDEFQELVDAGSWEKSKTEK